MKGNWLLYKSPGKSQIIQSGLLNEVSKQEFLESGGFVLAPFDSTHATKYFQISLETYMDENSYSGQNGLIGGISFSDYKKVLESSLLEISKCTFQKVVLARTIKLTGRLNYIDIFHDLVKDHQNAFVYCMLIDGVVWIGASPERLICKRNNKISSDALAGTLSNAAGNHWSDKEYREHKIVVDSVKESYRKYAKDIVVSERIEVSAGPVRHLLQTIEGQLKQKEYFFELVTDLHPTPAVSGLPKENTVQWILDNEQIDRDLYSGYLGFYSQDSADLFVNLRCLKYENEITTIYVGGGIVEGSTFENESAETMHKADTLLSSIKKFHDLKFEHD